MTGTELARRCKNVAEHYKTLYVMGCFGAPLNDANKARYCRNHPYNRKAARTAMIRAASPDTFGFDCVNLIKGILWGWTGDMNKSYGGASYASNGVRDVSANGMINLCRGVSKTGWNQMEVGEAVWLDGHIGVYLGNGLAVECTPKWKNCVQITAVGNIGKKAGYNTRTWTKHGKIPYVTYGDEPVDKPEVEDLTKAETEALINQALPGAVEQAVNTALAGKDVTDAIARAAEAGARAVMAEYAEQRQKEPAAPWASALWTLATDCGIVDGSRPGDYMTRQEGVKLAYTMRDAFSSGLLDNDAGEWSEQARKWAVESGLVNGVGTLPDGTPNYAWESPMSREQMVTMLYRALAGAEQAG